MKERPGKLMTRSLMIHKADPLPRVLHFTDRQSGAFDRPGCESVHIAIHRQGLDADPWGCVPAFNSRTLGRNRRRFKGGNDS